VADPVRWGILGNARIVHTAFLPALQEAGGGRVVAVASRTAARAQELAREAGAEAAWEGYERVLEDPRVEAVYIPLPNSLHAMWTQRALEAGKAVLTEKPLCLSVAQTQEVLNTARRTGGLLWEAFVFPFGAQAQRVRELVEAGAVGEVREIRASLHGRLLDRGDIRWQPHLGGGSLLDMGCYPLHFATQLLSSAPREAFAHARREEGQVDEEVQGFLTFPGGEVLLFSCGFGRPYEAGARILGTLGEIQLTSPYHPRPHDTLTLRLPDRDPVVERPTTHTYSFTPALSHIHRVLRGEQAPRHLAVDDALPTSQALEAVQRAAGLIP
jgi:predicted dehydrogenase